MTTPQITDLYVGLTELKLVDSPIELGEGIVLQNTHAQFLSPLMLVNTSQAKETSGEMRPAYWQIGGRATDVTAELLIPSSAAPTFDERIELGRLIVLLVRLWTNPAVGLHVISSHRFASLTELPESDRPVLIPIETFPRHFHLGLVEHSQITASLAWVKDNWKIAQQLYRSSAEFRLAADALDSGQFVPNTALTLVSLWGALEAIFSPSTSELKFRVSALIASYIEPPGLRRIQLQKEVAGLYDKRSAAAHGKPRHQGDDLLKTFELLRKVIIRMIREKKVPSKDDLEKCLFVGTQ